MVYLRYRLNTSQDRYTDNLSAGNCWHIDCFRCNTCSTTLDSDSNLLLLGDGSLICNNCTYSCSVCNNKIEDLAILTEDQAFCATCFKCRNCKRKIKNLKYGRTSQGILCIPCHERRRMKASSILGDQAFCATCYKCNTKIENLEYARTSQGRLCMECHESLKRRRRMKASSILGDQAFCPTCYKCNTKIENLEFAIISQGKFCMDCYELLMYGRKKALNKERELPVPPPSSPIDETSEAGFLAPDNMANSSMDSS